MRRPEVRPYLSAECGFGGKAHRETLGVQLEIECEVQARSCLTCMSCTVVATSAHFAFRVRSQEKTSFATGIVAPQNGLAPWASNWSKPEGDSKLRFTGVSMATENSPFVAIENFPH